LLLLSGLVMMWLAWHLLLQRLLQRSLLVLLVKGVYGLLQLYLPYPLLLYLLPHDLSPLHNCPSSDHVLLLEPKVLVFLAKVYQFILYKSLDFLIILMLVIFSLDFQWWVLVVLLL
jgi:hypothetical protein